MASLNRVTLIGHLGADPEVRYTQNREAITTIRIATTETYKDKSAYFAQRDRLFRSIVTAV